MPLGELARGQVRFVFACQLHQWGSSSVANRARRDDAFALALFLDDYFAKAFPRYLFVRSVESDCYRTLPTSQRVAPAVETGLSANFPRATGRSEDKFDHCEAARENDWYGFIPKLQVPFQFGRENSQGMAQKKQFGTRLPDVLSDIVSERAELMDESQGGYISLIVQWWFAQGAPPVNEFEAKLREKHGDKHTSKRAS